MKHFVFNILIITLTLFVSCGKYDDSQLWSKLEEHESRISKLEKQCRELNSNISALQTLVVALQNNLYITSVRPISEYGKEVGYSISFSNGDTAKIYHGKDGKDGSAGENGADGKDGKDGENGRDGEDGLNGSTPVIGVAQDSDGVYYWTIDGQWLLDNEGNKLRVTGENGRDGTDGKDGVDGKDGKDGADGVTGRDGLVPFLLIKDGYWWISYGGQYAKTSKRATGEDGKNGIDGKDGKDGVDGIDGKDGVGVFSSVVVSEESIEFTLVDGRCFSIAINEKSKVSISFRDTDIPNTVVVNVDFDSFDNVYAKIEAFSGVYTKSVIGWSLDSITRSDENNTVTITYTPGQMIENALLIVSAEAKNGITSTISKVLSSSILDWKDLSAQGTANCYIVPEAGSYSIRAIKGNSSEVVTGISEIETDSYLLEELTYSDGRLYFRTANLKGNGIITAKDAKGEILWTWHIWLTDIPKDQVYNNGAGIMMDRNLGATTTYSTKDDDMTYKGLTYQWGYLKGQDITTWDKPLKLKEGSWGKTKTIFDPCPYGYRVSDIDVWFYGFGAENWQWGEDLMYPPTPIYENVYNMRSYLTSEDEDCWLPISDYLNSEQRIVNISATGIFIKSFYPINRPDFGKVRCQKETN